MTTTVKEWNGAELIVKPEETRRVIAVLETTERPAKEVRELPLPFEAFEEQPESAPQPM